MAYKAGDTVVVLHNNNWKDGVVIARMSRTEYQVKLDNGSSIHVHPKHLLNKGKKKK